MMRTPTAILAALTTLGLGLAAGPAAQASGTYGEVESFGAGAVEKPFGVAVNASGDVYVSSFDTTATYSLDEFTTAGSLLAPPSPFGTGTRLGGTGGPTFFSGLAVDPVDEHLYVVDGDGQDIQTYKGSSGALLSQFPVAGSANLLGFLTAVQIAAGAAGEVYLPNAPNNEVQEFSPEGAVLATFVGSGASALKEPTGVALDAAGDVYVADAGNGRIEEFSPSGTALASIAAAGVQSLALDASGDIFALEHNSEDSCGALPAPCLHVVLYSPAGARLADFGAGTLAATPFGEIDTLAVAPNGAVYVTDGGNNLVRVYAQQKAPSLAGVKSVAVSYTTATLRAAIGQGDADTSYRFEYGTSTGYGTSIPVPDGDVGTGLNGPAEVGQELSGLRPGTTYHYRVLATNALGQVASPDQTFTTLPPQPPVVSTGQAGDVAQSSATLTGTIETQGLETTYEFDLGTDTSYGTRIFGDAGFEPGPQMFRVELQGLAPGSTYHYRIVATNLFGTSYGADVTFTTATYPSSTLATPPASTLVPAPLLVAAGTASGAHAASARPAARTALHGRASKSAGRRGGRKRKGRPGGPGGARHARGANRGKDKR
jgi:hypothetical protein